MALIQIGNVEDEYKKLRALKKEDVLNLKNWVEAQSHLPNITEMQAIHFLHSNQYSEVAARKCIETFFTARTHSPEFFANRNPQNLQLDVMLYTPLPQLTPEGHRIIYARLMDLNPDNYSFANQIKIFDMATMLMINKDGTSEGQIVIHDMTGLSFSHITKINLVYLKKFFYYLQESMPVKLKGLHFMNTGNLIDKLLVIIKPFMKKNLIDLVHTHPEVETIYQYVPKECLPRDFGGEAPSITTLHEKLKQDFLGYSEFFCEEEKQVIDEGRRPGKPKDAKEVFGIEDNFQDLKVD